MSDLDESLLGKMRAMQQVMLERELDVQQQLDALHARVAELEQRGKDVSRPAE